jgi:general secretion pathway protein I
MRRHPSTGFTLIEVLVALSIVATALLAGLQATGALGRNAERQSLLPDTGTRQVECPQAGQELQVELAVQATPNPNFRRVDARVRHEGQMVLQVSTVMGRN